MTPKEKAIELHNKILNITYDDRDMPGEPTWVSTKCALIAVDEIIEFMEVDDFDSDTCYWANHSKMQYWLEVKKEIEKL
jgi:hypothetical protein